MSYLETHNEALATNNWTNFFIFFILVDFNRWNPMRRWQHWILQTTSSFHPTFLFFLHVVSWYFTKMSDLPPEALKFLEINTKTNTKMAFIIVQSHTTPKTLNRAGSISHCIIFLHTHNLARCQINLTKQVSVVVTGELKNAVVIMQRRLTSQRLPFMAYYATPLLDNGDRLSEALHYIRNWCCSSSMLMLALEWS